MFSKIIKKAKIVAIVIAIALIGFGVYSLVDKFKPESIISDEAKYQSALGDIGKTQSNVDKAKRELKSQELTLESKIKEARAIAELNGFDQSQIDNILITETASIDPKAQAQ